MNYAVQVAQIIKAALDGDTDKVKRYAEFIAEMIDDDAAKCAPVARADFEREARIIRRAYGAESTGRPAALDEMQARKPGALPGDEVRPHDRGPMLGGLTR
jgi:hypothetical protein